MKKTIIHRMQRGLNGIFHFPHRRLRCRNACKRATLHAHADQNQVTQHEQHRLLPFIIIRFVRKAEGSQAVAPGRCDVIRGKDLKLVQPFYLCFS